MSGYWQTASVLLSNTNYKDGHNGSASFSSCGTGNTQYNN